MYFYTCKLVHVSVMGAETLKSGPVIVREVVQNVSVEADRSSVQYQLEDRMIAIRGKKI